MNAKLCLLAVIVLSMAVVGVASAGLPPQPDPIPEFPTVSVPVIAILGLLFFFSYCKRRNEEHRKENEHELERGE